LNKSIQLIEPRQKVVQLDSLSCHKSTFAELKITKTTPIYTPSTLVKPLRGPLSRGEKEIE